MKMTPVNLLTTFLIRLKFQQLYRTIVYLLRLLFAISKYS